MLFNHVAHWHVYKAELSAAIREKEKRGPQLNLWAPRAGWALYLRSDTYYMLITAILKLCLQGVNLVRHYSGLYFRVLCEKPLWDFFEAV